MRDIEHDVCIVVNNIVLNNLKAFGKGKLKLQHEIQIFSIFQFIKGA